MAPHTQITWLPAGAWLAILVPVLFWLAVMFAGIYGAVYLATRRALRHVFREMGWGRGTGLVTGGAEPIGFPPAPPASGT